MTTLQLPVAPPVESHDGVPWAGRLRELREARALSQRDLAGLAGVSPTTIVRLEREGATGRSTMPVQFKTIRKLAAALGVEVAELMYSPGERPGGQP